MKKLRFREYKDKLCLGLSNACNSRDGGAIIKGKFNVLATAVAVVAMLVSCHVNDDINERERNNPVRFTAEITGELSVPQSRAAGTDWDASDAVGIFMTQSGTVLAANKKYGAQTSGAIANFEAASTADEIFYPQTGSVNFIAYYPYVSTAILTRAINVKIATKQTVTDIQPTFNLLYSNDATNISNSDNAVELNFEHKLSKLIMNVKAGDGLIDTDLTGMTVTVKGMNTENTFDLSTGSLGTPGIPADITPRSLTVPAGFAASYDVIILPSAATVNDGDYAVDFSINPGANQETFTWKMDAATKFDGGNEYTYTVSVARTGATATGTIKPWGPNNGGLVTAE